VSAIAPPRHRERYAKQSMRSCSQRNWIASSQSLLEMTGEAVDKPVEALWKTGG
jgi:hypothetical protein